jgi:hypothetical protein
MYVLVQVSWKDAKRSGPRPASRTPLGARRLYIGEPALPHALVLFEGQPRSLWRGVATQSDVSQTILQLLQRLIRVLLIQHSTRVTESVRQVAQAFLRLAL